MNYEIVYMEQCLKIFNDHSQCIEEVGAYISRHYISDAFRKARRELTPKDRNRILCKIADSI